MKLRPHARVTRPKHWHYRAPAGPPVSSLDLNAYRNCPQLLTPAGGGNLTLTALTYTADPWGRGWYATATPSLLNAGSRTAAAAGLFHYTTQPNQTKEAITPVDIGFHYVAVSTSTGRPVDTDGDGLPDYLEDTDGDGLPDVVESNWQDSDTDDDGIGDGAEAGLGTDPTNPDTDYDGLPDSQEPAGGMNPLHPDSDGDGWPDGAEVAPDLDLYLYSYTLNVTRDFNTSPRQTVLPDAYVTMTWQHHATGSLYKSGDRSECLPPTPPPPPETIRTEGDDYAWPASGCGSRRYWKTTYGNSARQYEPPVVIDRPPSAEINVPWERCTGFVLSMNPPNYSPPFTGTYTRSASAIIHLQSAAPTWPKPMRSVILSVQATDKTAGGDLYPGATGYDLGEPVEGNTGVAIAPAVTEIIVDNQPTDAAGTVLIQLNKVAEKDVTPHMDVPWYRFDMQKVRPTPVLLTWSRHPGLAAGQIVSLQQRFDQGALLLAKDDDSAVNDTELDDVSWYAEFFILPARKNIFPDGLTNTFYLDVSTPEDRDRLRTNRFASVKLVRSLSIYGIPLLGWGEPGVAGIVLVNDKSAVAPVHEYGHTAGLEHRTNDSQALMYPSGGNKINAVERYALEEWAKVSDPWND